MSERWDRLVYKSKEIIMDREVFTAGLLVLVAVSSFGLGRQSVNESDAQPAAAAAALTTDTTSVLTTNEVNTGDTYYVASKNGEAYHLPFCSGAKRISEKNKITFESKEAAEASGYRPAANCPGLE